MIAHIRPPKPQRPEPVSPLARARQMVAEALLPDRPTRPQRRAAVRKVLYCGGGALLAAVACLAYYLFR
jgi:hypothetical protein